MPKLVKVIGSTLDGTKLTLFLEDGSIEYIQQGSKLLTPEFVASISNDVITKGFSLVQIVEDTPIVDHAVAYKKLTEFSQGSIKFFKAAKDFYEEHQEDIDMFLKLLLTEGEQVNSADIDNDDVTIHAVVDDDKVVPNVNKIEEIIFNIEDNPEGVAALIKRMANVQRNHNTQDILDFLKTTKLPLTNKGEIIFFKSVYSTEVEGEFVDCHTRQVKQYVGSLVSMDESLVDPDRKRDCSNGLHIASIQYVRSFSGNAILVGIVRPEDVIAVPEYDHTKVRTKAYQVLGVVDKYNENIIRKEGSISNCTPEFKKILQGIVEGNFPPARRTTTIIKQRPQEIVYGSVDGVKTEINPEISTTAKEPVKAETVTVKAAVAEIKETKAVKVAKTEYNKAKAVKPNKTLTNKQNMDRLVGMFKTPKQTNETYKSLADQIMQLKRKMKQGWDKLGVTEDWGKSIIEWSKK